MDPVRGLIHLGLKTTETALDRALDVIRLADTLLVSTAVPALREQGREEPVWPEEEQADLDAMSATLRARRPAPGGEGPDTDSPATTPVKKAPAKKVAAKKSTAATKKTAAKKAPATKATGAKKASTKKSSAPKKAPTKKATTTKAAASKKTTSDD